MTVAERDLVVAGIPYRRSHRAELRERVAHALDRCDERRACAELLRDRDDWAPGDGPTLADAEAAIDAPTLRDAMDRLGYGPVADYFAYRLSDPTYLSGLALLQAFAQRPVFELGCGIGQLLRAIHPRGAGTAGADVVFSKLWLARRWVVPDAALVCFDAADPFPFTDDAFGAALCHDALYFLPDKRFVVAELARVSGTVLIGHTHNALAENHSAGDPLDPEGYADLLPGARIFDDAELTAAYVERRAPASATPQALHSAAAISLVRSANPDFPVAPATGNAGFSRNPLLRRDGRVAWPSARYREEYAPLSGHLSAPAHDAAERAHLRQDLDLPAEWGVQAPPLGIGVIGCGWVARDFVLPALAEASRARAVCGYDPAGVPDGLTDAGSLDSLLAHPDVEAVYVATPNDLHADAVIAAAQTGKAVLCEKPMAATLADARRSAAAVEQHGVAYATAFDQRHHPAHTALRDLIAAGHLGTVTAVRIVYCCWVGPDWTTDNWRADPVRAGGGALIDLAPHGLDLAQHLLADELAELTALRQHRVHDYAVEDGAVLIGRTRSDVLVTSHVAYNHPEDRPRRRLEVIGTGGLAVATDTLGQDPGGTLTVDGEPVTFDDKRSPFTAQLDWFAGAVLDGPPLTPDADLRLMELLEPWR